MIEITFKCESLQEATALLQRVSVDPPAVVEEKAVKAPAAKPASAPTGTGKRKYVKKPRLTLENPVVPPEGAEVIEPPAHMQTPVAPQADPELSVLHVRAAFEPYYEAHGLQGARDLLSRFGCQRLGELQPESYAAFIEACESGEPA